MYRLFSDSIGQLMFFFFRARLTLAIFRHIEWHIQLKIKYIQRRADNVNANANQHFISNQSCEIKRMLVFSVTFIISYKITKC